MHYAHVNCKEKTMNRYSMEEYYRLPDLGRRLDVEAHRERARAIYAGLAWLYTQGKARLTARPGGWIERLG
jgi:hypothetical protein